MMMVVTFIQHNMGTCSRGSARMESCGVPDLVECLHCLLHDRLQLGLNILQTVHQARPCLNVHLHHSLNIHDVACFTLDSKQLLASSTNRLSVLLSFRP